MTLANKTLYNTLSDFKIDNDMVALSFSDRLCRENNWNKSYSDQVIVEYKRFIYLICISEKPITPSDQIDQAWHLHLTYTRSYWVELCNNILKQELHHCPTIGGKAESDKYKKQYQYTLDLYEREFGITPATEIWPTPEERFRDADKFVRLNKSTHWLIEKPPKFTSALILFSLFLIACTHNEGESEFWFYIKVAFGIYIVYKIIQWLFRNIDGKGGGSGGAGCGGCGGCGG